MPDLIRAVLIATNRSGSTFLNHALDSHPTIRWERGEPLTAHRGTVEPVIAVNRLLSQDGVTVAGCKLSYRYLRRELGFSALADLGVTRIIHLHRENVVRAILSSTINTMTRDGLPHVYHTTVPVPPVRIVVDVETFIGECKRYVDNVTAMKRSLRRLGIPVLYVTYADIVGGEGHEAHNVPAETAHRLCDFLGVDAAPLYADLVRVNPQPAHELVENWHELVAVLRCTRFIEDIEHETA